MYKISVPVINARVKRMGREKIFENLKRLDAERVLLAIGSYITDSDAFARELSELRDNCSFFHSQGFEVGVWLWSFMVNAKHNFVFMEGPLNKSNPTIVCPSDASFRDFAKDYVKELASCGVDMILFDDDFRYGHGVFGCKCKNHIAHMEKTLGEKLDSVVLDTYLLSGGKNRYRDAWVESKGYFFRLFAKEIRDAVDKVNPNIRVGVCSCMSLWDHDGVDSVEISKILAGNTQPFLRLIGAPYWAVNRFFGCRLQNVIELSRMERSWCPDDIEILAEGDVYPRPRTNCPGNYLELLDIAMRADGELDGIMKYGIDYHSNATYEMGYIERHEKNKPLYAEVEKYFRSKTACGVRNYEKMNKYLEMEIPEAIAGTTEVENSFFSVGGKMLADNSIPSVYNGMGVAGIAFAENITMVSEKALRRGVVIDLAAAKILMKKGIDVGITKIKNKVNVQLEYFVDDDEFTELNCRAYDVEISPSAKVSSKFIYKTGQYDCNGLGVNMDDVVVGSYRYTNSDGYQFFVFCFDAYYNGERLHRSYARSKQLASVIESFGNEKLPAYSYGSPDLYIMAKKDEGVMAVGLWNIFADSILNPIVELDQSYSKIHFINCSGELKGDKVYLQEIPPFGFAGFEVK